MEKTRYLIGKNAILEVYKNQKERLLHIYTHKIDDPFLQKIKGVKVTFKPKAVLEKMCHSTSHQGFVAKLAPKKEIGLNALFGLDLIVALDEVQDPHNLGAILRACECFGVKGVIFSKNRGAQVNATVSKTSQGASEVVPLCTVSNLVTTLDQFKKQGYQLIGADVDRDAFSLFTFHFPKKSILLLGSEMGLRPLLKKKCDLLLKIPLFGQIDSLNVSQATAVLLYAWQKDRF
jgi:23S rRNA (guanosine2251-2'-O)-methyltransferase